MAQLWRKYGAIAAQFSGYIFKSPIPPDFPDHIRQLRARLGLT